MRLLLDRVHIKVKDLLRGSRAKRSRQWPKVRREHLKQHPACAACGSTRSIEVHHKEPFHIFPALELDPANLISLCDGGLLRGKDHFSIGHLGSWKRYNINVETDAAAKLQTIKPSS